MSADVSHGVVLPTTADVLATRSPAVGVLNAATTAVSDSFVGPTTTAVAATAAVPPTTAVHATHADVGTPGSLFEASMLALGRGTILLCSRSQPLLRSHVLRKIQQHACLSRQLKATAHKNRARIFFVRMQ